jgi:V/A-type H+/Na+-transporting ATPase subunit E
MEIVRSTEALEREVLEDARKRADKILKTVEQNLARSKEDREAETAKRISRMEALVQEELHKHRTELASRLPLEKRRLRLQRSSQVLDQAMQRFLGSLKREEILELLYIEAASRISELPSRGDLEFVSGGLSEVECAALAARLFPERPCATRIESIVDSPPHLIIYGQKVSVQVSLAELGERLLDEQRQELAAALLGQEVLND